MQAECKQCGKTKAKIRVPYEKKSRFTDESGKLWWGKLCPPCFKQTDSERCKKAYHDGKPKGVRTKSGDLYRVEPDYTPIWELGPRSPQYADKMRKCKHCGSNTHNYYMCKTCHDALNTDDFNDYVGLEF